MPASVAAHQKRDPETFLARIAIIAEGKSEIGFVEYLLQRAISEDLLDLGIWITDGTGNDSTLKLLEGLVGTGLKFAGFADDEGRDSGKWMAVQTKLKKLLFRWPKGCLEENVIDLVPSDRLEDLIKDPSGDSGDRLRTLAERLGIAEKGFSDIKAKATDVTKLIIEAATGSIRGDGPDAYEGEAKAWKKHAQVWFKSVDGGRELAMKVFDLGLWPKLRGQLLPFLNAVRVAVSLPEIAELPP